MKLFQLFKKHAKPESELTHLVEMQQLQAQIESLQIKLQQQSVELEGKALMQQRYAIQQQTLSNYQQAEILWDAKKTALIQENDALKLENKRLQSSHTLAAFEIKIINLQQKLSTLTNYNEQLTLENARLTKHAEAFDEERFNELSHKLEVTTTLHEKALNDGAALQFAHTLQKLAHAQLQQQHNALQFELSQTQKKVAQLTAEQHIIAEKYIEHKQHAQTVHELELATTTAIKAEQQHKLVQAQLDESNQKLMALTNELSKLHVQNEQHQQVAHNNQRLKELQQKYTQAMTANDNAMRIVEGKLQKEITLSASLREKLEIANFELQQLKEKYPAKKKPTSQPDTKKMAATPTDTSTNIYTTRSTPITPKNEHKQTPPTVEHASSTIHTTSKEPTTNTHIDATELSITEKLKALAAERSSSQMITAYRTSSATSSTSPTKSTNTASKTEEPLSEFLARVKRERAERTKTNRTNYVYDSAVDREGYGSDYYDNDHYDRDDQQSYNYYHGDDD